MHEKRVPIPPNRKALTINLDPTIYGTFSEIGAGQEVVRHFFRAGVSSGTIAKAMSAYDKAFSDAIYGKEKYNRYVCKSRLEKMISHEYGLIEARLDKEEHKNTRYFSFANTVTTTGYGNEKSGHGWVGVRFQLDPGSPPNDVIVHIRMHEKDNKAQQESIGVFGVNLIYACFFYNDDPITFLESLYDDLNKHIIEVDMIEMRGPDFDLIDNRLLSLYLVKLGMTEAVIFGPDGKNLHPSEVLYKKNILAIRGSFRPVTKVNIDMIKTGYNAFAKSNKVSEDKIEVLFEITLSNLKFSGDIEEADFIDRADILCSLGQTVLISNYKKYYKLVEYLSGYTKERMGLIIGVENLIDIFDEKYYRNLKGGILQALGIMFMCDIKAFLYPRQLEPGGRIENLTNIEIHPRLKPLFDYLAFNKRIIDIENYDPSVLQIYSHKVIDMIKNGESGWEDKVPVYVDSLIKEGELFGYSKEKVLTD